MTCSEARSAADDLVPFVSEESVLLEATIGSPTAIKEKSSLLKLVQSTQELDLQCRQISSQLCDLSLEDTSLALALQQRLQHYSKDGLIWDLGCVLVLLQEAIQNQLLEVYHNCPSGGHWGRDKMLELIQCNFIWDGIADDI